jgi:hypothetical protein
MPFRLTIFQHTANGEQLTVEVSQINPITGEKDDNDTIQEAFRFAQEEIDRRLYNMNMRHLEAMGLIRDNHYFPVEYQQKFLMLMQVLGGQLDAKRVKMIWDSEIEETLELQKEREAHRPERGSLIETDVVVEEANCAMCSTRLTYEYNFVDGKPETVICDDCATKAGI